jgi:hypothetical protein
MLHAKQALKPKRKSRVVPVLGAAGLSLSLASGTSAAPAADMLMRNTGTSHEITLAEEEIFDVSLATFYVVDKENAQTFRPGRQLAMGGGCGCGGCGCGGCAGVTANYGASTLGSDANPPRASIKPAHGYTHALKRTHVPRNP